MRIHHLNAITACALGGALMDGRTAGLRGRLASHCLLVEGRDGLVLVDTGYGLRDVHEPRRRLAGFFLFLNAPELREEMTCVRQIERLGHDPRDVRHVVLTHLDFDHAGGLDDFPWATVHLLDAERTAAEARRTALDRMRYRPQQWGTRHRWRAYRSGEGEPWLGFDCVRGLEDLPSDDVLLVPLIGHTLGHAGVAVRRDHGWLLLAGDAYFDARELAPDVPRCRPGLRVYQWLMEKDRRARLWNQARLRDLAADRGGEVEVISSHDPYEFERLAGRPMDRPLAPMLHPPTSRAPARPAPAAPPSRPGDLA
jgi:glyoxylase-like metal-dependent hydrolase (beta-lactamase superfamily II)